MLLSKKESYVYLIICIGAIYSFLAGITMTWTSPMIEKLKNFNSSDYPFDRETTENERSWIVSSASLGSIAGPIFFAKLPNVIGRKYSLLLVAIPMTISYGLTTFSHDINLFIVARALAGIGISSILSVFPIYNNEIVRSENRGMMHGAQISAAMLGSLTSYSVGAYASIFTFNLIIFLIAASFVPLFWILGLETPYYLISKGKVDLATKYLKKLRGYSGKELENEVEEIKIYVEKKVENSSVFDIFRIPVARRAFFLSTSLLCLQQLSGTTLITSYAQTIFSYSGTSFPPQISAIILGAVQLIASLLNPILTDRVGRKVLLFTSTIGLGIALIILGIFFYLKDNTDIDLGSVSFLPTLCLVFGLALHVIGVAPTSILITSELYPMNVKFVGNMASNCIQFSVAYVLSQYFTSLIRIIKLGPLMWIFAFCDFMFALFSYFFLLETKGKSMQEIQVMLANEVKDELRVKDVV